MLIERTQSLIRELHAGQTDMSGLPFHLHPERVMKRAHDLMTWEVLEQLVCSPVDVLHAALLHDVVEDTPMTLECLANQHGYSPATIEMVRLVTRPVSPRPAYMTWVRGIVASGNVGAMVVKLADNEDNTCPSRPSTAMLPPGMVQRYERSKRVLRTGLRL
jgi:(p)ppGpp synthase/HD superfamily hydrolase